MRLRLLGIVALLGCSSNDGGPPGGVHILVLRPLGHLKRSWLS